MVIGVRGTTDLPMKNVFFTMTGLHSFLQDVFRTDTQDFVGKIEGFAVHSVKGQFSSQ